MEPADTVTKNDSSDLLHQHRRDAAQASGGISAESDYEAIFGIIAAQGIHGRTLDFGAGVGNVASHLRGCPVTQVVATDITDRPVGLPTDIEWIQADLNSPLPLPDRIFDAIVSIEVIEHLENPRAVFREFRRLLKPGDRVVLTTPNQESIRSLSALLLTGHFSAFISEESYSRGHITALLRRDFQRICRETGFGPPSFFYTDAGRIPKMTQWSWQQLSFGWLRGRLFSDRLIVSTQYDG